MLEVTGLQPCLKDFSEFVEEADLAPLLEPPYGMKRPQMRKLLMELGRLKGDAAVSLDCSVEVTPVDSQRSIEANPGLASDSEAAHAAEIDDLADIHARVRELFKVLEPGSDSKSDRENPEVHELSAGSSTETATISPPTDRVGEKDHKNSEMQELSAGSSGEDTVISPPPGLWTPPPPPGNWTNLYPNEPAPGIWTALGKPDLHAQRRTVEQHEHEQCEQEPAAKRVRASKTSTAPSKPTSLDMLDNVRSFLVSALKEKGGMCEAGLLICNLYQAVTGAERFVQKLGGTRKLCEQIAELMFDNNKIILKQAPKSAQCPGSVSKAVPSFQTCKRVLLSSLRKNGSPIHAGALASVYKQQEGFRELVDRMGGVRAFCDFIGEVKFDRKTNSIRLADAKCEEHQSGKKVKPAPYSVQKQKVAADIEKDFEKYMRERRNEG
eukprot:TRINITY_DN33207_c0_g1_i1.p1 TRINITY_DN33207_c0_g1~~TRINITY_DN33207_c0_g1_i1.p1  ORF type:complete len:471 (+),score=89.33 TRINITY_DN33207_c0_g1_i1:101-1414(+)